MFIYNIVMQEFVNIYGTHFNTSITWSKEKFYDKFKDKRIYPFDLDEAWAEIVKNKLNKTEKPEKEK